MCQTNELKNGPDDGSCQTSKPVGFTLYDPPMEAYDGVEVEPMGWGRAPQSITRVTLGNTVSRSDDDTPDSEKIPYDIPDWATEFAQAIWGIKFEGDTLMRLLLLYATGQSVLDDVTLSSLLEDHIGSLLAIGVQLGLVEMSVMMVDTEENTE